MGLLGLLKIPLDIMTITVAAISVGMAVDNTIHYIYRYKKELKKTNSVEKARKCTQQQEELFFIQQQL